jgi:Ca-activated chloride channel family protein
MMRFTLALILLIGAGTSFDAQRPPFAARPVGEAAFAGWTTPTDSFGLRSTLALLTYAQTQTFRSAVNTVPIYATVTDTRGELVTNLTANDFQIDDDGRRQTVTVFKSDVEPMTLAILLDRSPSLFGVAERLQSVVSEFVKHLLPNDRACLGAFSHVVTLNSALTSDAAILLKRLGDEAPFPAGTAMWDAIDAGRKAVVSEGGRRVVLVVTDAMDNSSASDIDAVRRDVERDGVIVYAVGARGREGLEAHDLTGLARTTGGWYLELKPTDDVATAAQRIADELHRQYVLGFSPRALDDKRHRLEVRVNRPGLTVRARRSYFAASHDELR